MAAGKSSPRSVADATRFTSNRPHANTKSASSPNVKAAAAAQKPHTKPQSPPPPPQRPQQLPRRSVPNETLDERVRRLRAAHLAAKQHSVSRMDKVIDSSRRLFDAAHKFTVVGLIGFSGIALLVTAYATVDMMMLNRKRRNEFFAVQKQLREDSLEAARLAYMTGTATDDQIALVEDATAQAEKSGRPLPSILSRPQSAAPAGGREAYADSDLAAKRQGQGAPEVEEEEKKGGLTGWLFGGLRKEDDAQTAEDQWRNHNTSTTTSSSTTTTTASAMTEQVGDALRTKAKEAFDTERDHQRTGGPLDQVGLDGTAAASTATETESSGKKKGWLW
ncbi:hypothetical protein F4808DRAFT_413549 [Astrocystis sublimbata]|nr:hypothetical protein F4808DRAFT_413549 [Astrocystis sublimbata]